jgi:hypothetical protein
MYLDYGWTRPKVMSRGAFAQEQGTSDGARDSAKKSDETDPDINEPAPLPETKEAGYEGEASEPSAALAPPSVRRASFDER